MTQVVTKQAMVEEISKALQEGRRPDAHRMAKRLASIGGRPLAAPYGSPIVKVERGVRGAGGTEAITIKKAAPGPRSVGGLRVTEIVSRAPVFDESAFLEELPIRDSTKKIIRLGWPWYQLELGGGVRTVTAQMIAERTDKELLAIPMMTKARVREIRKAIAADPGCLTDQVSLDHAGARSDRAAEPRFEPATGRPLRSPLEEVTAD